MRAATLARSCRCQRALVPSVGPNEMQRCAVANRRSAAALRDSPRPAWPEILALVADAPVQLDVLPADAASGDAALEALQVTTSSFLGAIAGECGAILVDHRWLRILGAGAQRLPGVHEVNVLTDGPPPLLEVARDVLGGRFAVNGGGLAAAPGEVCYWGPDTLSWTPIGAGHAAFVSWALAGGTTEFYDSLRWDGWEHEVASLSTDQGLSLYPPPFTVEGRDLASVRRAVIPLSELHSFYDEMARQLPDGADGSTFEFKVTD